MSAKITVIADGRSPTARSWIAHLLQLGYEVSLVSSYYFDPIPGVSRSTVLPLALSRFNTRGGAASATSDSPGFSARLKQMARGGLVPLYRKLRTLIGPLTIRQHAKAYRAFLAEAQPDLVHALRIPYEGMLGSHTPPGLPLIVATWGNDLTLHANRSPWMRTATRRCLQRADGLTSDTQRDIRLAHEWGLRPNAPTLKVPGSGGLDLAAIDAIPQEAFDPNDFDLPQDAAWVVNPRGIRPDSVHQDVFFAAIPKVLAEAPETVFICPAMAGEQQALHWIEKWGIADHTVLLPKLTQTQLFALFKRCSVFVSPSSHDGTPNSLLEALACGCYPVAGQIESLAEWITPGINGTLVNPRDPAALAEGILAALRSPSLRQKAADVNRAIIQTQAADQATLPAIDTFYKRFLTS